MLDGIFGQGLQQQRWHRQMQRRGVNLPAHLHARTKADLLDVQITLGQLHFFAQGDGAALLM